MAASGTRWPRSVAAALLLRQRRTPRVITTLQISVVSCRLASSTKTTTTTTTASQHSTTRSERSPQALFHDLSNLFAQETALPVELSLNPYELHRHGRGESFHATQPPDIVVYPQHTDHVVQIVNYASQHGIPLIPFGVGTSVEGHVGAVQGGICLDMSRMNQIEWPTDDQSSVSSSSSSVRQSLPDPFVTVGAGVTRKQLNQALRHTGMQFVVDPGADATIGGMTACSASGTTAVLYGTMRDNILGLECVLADGKVVNCCHHTAPKSSAGYDLVSLLCGSEGTLGIITKVTVQLHPVPQYVAAATCRFPTLQRAANHVAMLQIGLGLPLLRCELLDSASLHAFYQYQKNNSSSNNDSATGDASSSSSYYPPTLFLEFQGPTERYVQEQIDLAESILVGNDDDDDDDVADASHDQNNNNKDQDCGGGFDFSYTWDATERQQMWKARHDLYYASLALRPGCSGALVTDVCVPLRQLAPLLQATADHVRDLQVVGPCFGHVGDGNFHCILPLLPEEDEEYRQRVDQVHQTLLHRALAVGGTCTGEHGIGQGKIAYLEQQLGPNGIHMMKVIKQALDPQNIMNPGKVLRIEMKGNKSG